MNVGQLVVLFVGMLATILGVTFGLLWMYEGLFSLLRLCGKSFGEGMREAYKPEDWNDLFR